MPRNAAENVDLAGMDSNFASPQIKICGLTRKDEAVACAALGADAIGFVFYAKSPRFVTMELARDIASVLPAQISRVGVFVDESFASIVQAVQFVGLQAIQLHGAEPPVLVEKLKSRGIWIIKTLFTSRKPFTNQAPNYPANAFLVESGLGSLPGGNARSWDYSQLKGFTREIPLILAGGLSCGNISAAIQQCQPDAIDLSSGVEISPGRKDLSRVKSIIQVVQQMGTTQFKRRIFNADS